MILKRWIIHSIAQNTISLLPTKISYRLYYYIQIKFGRLKKNNNINVEGKLKTSISIYEYAKKHNSKKETFFELGTGRTITLHIGLWILDFKKLITVDLNPYLSEELTKLNIEYIIKNADYIYELFREYISEKDYSVKISKLKGLVTNNINGILNYLNIQYIPYQDAQFLNFIFDNSIDIYFSDQVLEHIPEIVLGNIITESKRILTDKGISIHSIGLHDHFATIDKSISKINFLKFNKFTWNLIAGNKFMYHNRLRFPDYIKIFEKRKFIFLELNKVIDERSIELIHEGFKVHKSFLNYRVSDLATTSMKIVVTLNPN